MKKKEITIKQAADIVGVSVATIKNWIKAGYLIQIDKNVISYESLEMFMNDIAGKEKLNARANKLLKDTHDHKNVSEKIKQMVQKCNCEDISDEYEKSLSESYKNKEGIYYTPQWIIKDMFKNIPFKNDLKFLDPCCGSGNFIIEAIKHGISPENVYGFDTDENAVLITKKRIKEKFNYDSNNIKVGDFLEEVYKLKSQNIFFDFIFTNPPWGKKIKKNIRKKYAILYNCGDSLDTTALFLCASLSILNENGYLGFLVQESFFNISIFEDVRKIISTKKILRFVDYDKPFKKLMIKAQSIIIENKQSDYSDIINCEVNNITFNRTLNSFIKNPKCIFNFWVNNDEVEVIERLYSVKHITLKDKAKWALGIVTGNNKKFCVDHPKDGYIPVYKGTDITKNGLKKPSIYVLNDFSKFQQVASLELYQAPKKIIYKFISSDLCFYCDTEQRYILNSANLFIPYNINISYEQLTALLNSDIINWLFKKLFSTHKILRGDIELLPIHIDYYSTYKDFDENKYLEYLQIEKIDNGTYRIKK